MIGQITAAFIVILVGFTLLPTLQEQLTSVSASSNVTSSTSTLISFTPLLFGASILAAAIGIVVQALNKSELIDDDYKNDYMEDVKQNPNKKQTYEEYVKERLEVEELMK